MKKDHRYVEEIWKPELWLSTATVINRPDRKKFLTPEQR